jgi:hypothetical protein
VSFDGVPGAPPPDGPGPVEEAAAVRPYARTGGRTRPSGEVVLPIEALVSSVPEPESLLHRHTAETRRILELSADQYVSIAELSAHVRLPVGVVRVLVGDLVDEGLAHVHGNGGDDTVTAALDPATTLSVLESVLNGISAL